MEQLTNRLRAVVTVAGDLPTDFAGAADFYMDLGLPSVKAMQILMALEEEFSVSIPDDDFVDATSLDKLEAVLQRLLAAQDGQG